MLQWDLIPVFGLLKSVLKLEKIPHEEGKLVIEFLLDLFGSGGNKGIKKQLISLFEGHLGDLSLI